MKQGDLFGDAGDEPVKARSAAKPSGPDQPGRSPKPKPKTPPSQASRPVPLDVTPLEESDSEAAPAQAAPGSGGGPPDGGVSQEKAVVGR